jgi:hypothetical protein
MPTPKVDSRTARKRPAQVTKSFLFNTGNPAVKKSRDLFFYSLTQRTGALMLFMSLENLRDFIS